jgi:tetratricopeptide (TPR) repeat protein
MMRGLEQDAIERAERRKAKTAQAAALKQEGNEAFKVENYEEAIAKYAAAIRFDPGNALLYTNSALASLKLGDYDAALERCDVAIRADERCVKVGGIFVCHVALMHAIAGGSPTPIDQLLVAPVERVVGVMMVGTNLRTRSIRTANK